MTQLPPGDADTKQGDTGDLPIPEPYVCWVHLPADHAAATAEPPLEGYLLVTASPEAAAAWAMDQGIPLEALRPILLSADLQGVTMEDLQP